MAGSEYQRLSKPHVRRVRPSDPNYLSRMRNLWPWVVVEYRDAEGNEKGMAFTSRERAFRHAAQPTEERITLMDAASFRATQRPRRHQ